MTLILQQTYTILERKVKARVQGLVKVSVTDARLQNRFTIEEAS